MSRFWNKFSGAMEQNVWSLLSNADWGLLAMRAGRVLTRPAPWFGGLMAANTGTGAVGPASPWFWGYVVMFYFVGLAHKEISKRLRAREGWEKFFGEAVEVVKFEISAEPELSDDSRLAEAAEEVEQWLEDRGLEVWSRRKNAVVAEDGRYVAYRLGESPERADFVATYE